LGGPAKSPFRPGYNLSGWQWVISFAQPLVASHSILPAVLFSRICSDRFYDIAGGEVAEYPTEAAAVEALHRAFLFLTTDHQDQLRHLMPPLTEDCDQPFIVETK
jgi:hypothetical protein